LRRFLWENRDYQLTDMEVTTDGALSREQIVESAGIHEGINIFSIDLSAARRRLLEIPQVEHAEIQRVLPNKVSIAINERQPIAWIAAKYDEDPTVYAKSFLVDRKGILIRSNHQLAEYFHLPVIYGVQTENIEAGQTVSTPEMKAALDLVRLNLDSETQGRFQVRSIDVSKGYCRVVTDRNHARVTFGLDRIDWQLERLTTLLNRIEQNKQELQTVNLMVQRNVPVTFMPVPDATPEEAKKTEPKSETPAEKPAPTSIKKTDLSKAWVTGKVAPVRKAERAHSQPEKPVKRATPVTTRRPNG
jgi:cell division protein FtsQ